MTLQEISVTDKINEIMATLENVEHCQFDGLFQSGRNRMEVVATFLALLELMRLKLVRVNQGRIGGEILVFRAQENGLNADSPEEGEVDDEELGTEQASPQQAAEQQSQPESSQANDPVEEEDEEIEDDIQDGYTPES